MPLSIFFEYRLLFLQLIVSLVLVLLLPFLKLPIFFLHGLHIYIHPDSSQQSGIKAAVRRPGTISDSNQGENPEPRKRNKSKDKFEFDESNAQIFRIKLDESHLRTRLYFDSYCRVSNYFVVALSCLILNHIVVGKELKSNYMSSQSGIIVPILLGAFVSCQVFVLLVKVYFERSASRKEKQLSVSMAVLGFLTGLLICFSIFPSLLDFNFESVDSFGRICIAVLMGCFSGLLLMPAMKSARSFWVGTDQIGWNLKIVSCGWFARALLYTNYMMIVFSSFLWVNPFTKVLVNKNIGEDEQSYIINEVGEADRLVGNVGMSWSDFHRFRLWCLLVSGTSQFMVLRSNLQMYLNEAVLSWYQRLHGSKVPDLDYSRAKVFLHNHYLCLAVLQFLAFPVLVLIFLGLYHIDGDAFKQFLFACSFLPCSSFVKEVSLLMAWWVTFVYAIFTSATLVLYRRGFLYVS